MCLKPVVFGQSECGDCMSGWDNLVCMIAPILLNEPHTQNLPLLMDTCCVIVLSLVVTAFLSPPLVGSPTTPATSINIFEAFIVSKSWEGHF